MNKTTLENQKKKLWKEGIGSLFIATLMALVIRWIGYEANVIPTESMWPTLMVNDHIFVNKWIYGLRLPFTEKWLLRWSEPKSGEIIVFKNPENPNLAFIKRVVGVPGDRVYYEGSHLYINDQLVDHFVPPKDTSLIRTKQMNEFKASVQGANKGKWVEWREHLGNFEYSILVDSDKVSSPQGPFEVPSDSYFVLGDNRDMSWDSRFWDQTAFVPRSHLLGRPTLIWLSCEKMIPGIRFLCLPTSIRWNRFFQWINPQKKDF